MERFSASRFQRGGASDRPECRTDQQPELEQALACLDEARTDWVAQWQEVLYGAGFPLDLLEARGQYQGAFDHACRLVFDHGGSPEQFGRVDSAPEHDPQDASNVIAGFLIAEADCRTAAEHGIIAGGEQRQQPRVRRLSRLALTHLTSQAKPADGQEESTIKVSVVYDNQHRRRIRATLNNGDPGGNEAVVNVASRIVDEQLTLEQQALAAAYRYMYDSAGNDGRNARPL